MIKQRIFLHLQNKGDIPQLLDYASNISKLGFRGVTISALPPGHDPFQLLQAIGAETNLDMGLAVVSPLVFPVEDISMKLDQLGEMATSGRKVFVALAVGDPFLLRRHYSLGKSRFSVFTERVSSILSMLSHSGRNLEILIAGSGSRTLNFAINHNLGILFNGIWRNEYQGVFRSRNSFIISHFGEMATLHDTKVRIIARLLSELSNEQLRNFGVKNETINDLRRESGDSNGIEKLRNILTSELVSKVASIGQEEPLRLLIRRMISEGIEKVVISHYPINQWERLASVLN